MKIYLVGGAVRDKLLSLPIKERDWVVVGATSDDMLKLGYRQVGKEFPVFLHPDTNEEYALARMERKVKPGYKGFTFDTAPSVTLQEDLARRDLTINAMAETTEGELIDPYHGKQDLEQKILRHVSDAFVEDPVRILRVARFYARYAHLGFRVDPKTLALMQDMVKKGEVDALVAERVWKELERGLSEKHPEKFFLLLEECHALPILFPHLDLTNASIPALIAATALTPLATIRFAAFMHAMPDAKKSISALSDRYRVPNAYRELAILTALHYASALAASQWTADTLLSLFYSLDIFRREERFNHFLIACQAIAKAQGITFDQKQLMTLAMAAKSVDVQALLAKQLEGNELALQLKEERKNKITNCLNQLKNA